MAQNITSITKTGLFNSSELNFETLTDSAFSADLADCKDPVIILVDNPSGDGVLSCLPAERGFKKCDIILKSGMNCIFITSYGYKKNDGLADFQLTVGGASPAGKSVKVAIIKYTPVINH